MAQAVPLSRQLLEQASDDCDLATAEGRARMLAQARPLWQALPDGTLKRQLLGDLARHGQTELADLQDLWGVRSGAAPAPARERQGPLKFFRRGSIRVPPAGPADFAVRLLLQHADWWERLPGDDRQMLHELGGVHGEVVRWLEQSLEEHGPLPWATLHDAIGDQPWAETARAWVRAGLGDEGYAFDGLQQIIAELWRQLLAEEANAIIASQPSADDLLRYRALLDQIAALKLARMATSR